MQPKILKINFLDDSSIRSRTLLKKLSTVINIASAAFYLIVIFSLALDLPGPGLYSEAAASNIVFSEPAHLPANLDKIIFPAQTANLPVDRTNVGLPVRLQIPQIKVDVALEHVGLTAAGSVGVPSGRDNAAWFKLSPRPGDSGSAVIAGHYGYWQDGTESVFNDLNKLQPGDKLYVRDETGATVTFIMRTSRQYDQNADARDIFSSNDGQAHLLLVTCEGAWNKVSQSYPRRLVIFADKE